MILNRLTLLFSFSKCISSLLLFICSISIVSTSVAHVIKDRQNPYVTRFFLLRMHIFLLRLLDRFLFSQDFRRMFFFHQQENMTFGSVDRKQCYAMQFNIIEQERLFDMSEKILFLTSKEKQKRRGKLACYFEKNDIVLSPRASSCYSQLTTTNFNISLIDPTYVCISFIKQLH